jgi:probable rRNA maturation factor
MIEIFNDDAYPVDVAALEHGIDTTLAQAGATGASITLVLADNDAIQALNRTYRQVDAPTDVLSFPSGDTPAQPAAYLGDVMIAYPYARAQAERHAINLMDNLTLLAVHGTLHLLGYDHDTVANRQAMWAAQARVLESLGISQAIVPQLEDENDHE